MTAFILQTVRLTVEPAGARDDRYARVAILVNNSCNGRRRMAIIVMRP